MVKNLRSRLIQPVASSNRGLSWPRSFGLGLSKPRLTLDVKCTQTLSAALMLRPWKNVAYALFSIISQTFTAERLALQWRENDLQHKSCTREPEISSKPHLIHRRNISFKPLDWSLTNFSSRFPQTKVSQHPHTVILTEMLIWNEKDSVKYGDFPDEYQLFRFLRARLLLQITRGTKTNYNIIEPVWPRTKRRVNHLHEQFVTLGPRGWIPHMKGVGTLVGNFELNP